MALKLFNNSKMHVYWLKSEFKVNDLTQSTQLVVNKNWIEQYTE